MGKKTHNSTKNLESGSEQGPSAPPCDHQEYYACMQSISYSHALLSIFDLNTEPWHQFRNHFTIVMLNAEGRLCLPGSPWSSLSIRWPLYAGQASSVSSCFALFTMSQPGHRLSMIPSHIHSRLSQQSSHSPGSHTKGLVHMHASQVPGSIKY